MPRSSYYERKNRKPSKREIENTKYKKLILEIYHNNKRRYGSPKIQRKLKENHEIEISLGRVQRLMKDLNIKSIRVKKFRPSSSSKDDTDRPNLLNRDFSTKDINEKWVTDITYIHTVSDGWCYLASVMDLHSRKIIGYSFSKNMTTQITLDALNEAYNDQKPNKGVIIHSDRGSQYTSNDYQNRVTELKMKQSFSAKGDPFDNSPIESFHSTLKLEEVYCKKYLNYKEAKISMFKFIRGWYNRKRIHGSIGYLTPEKVEQNCRKSA